MGRGSVVAQADTAGRYARLQVSSRGRVAAVSAAGAKGSSALDLSGGRGLGREGAQRLADLLREAPPPFLASLDLR